MGTADHLTSSISIPERLLSKIVLPPFAQTFPPLPSAWSIGWEQGFQLTLSVARSGMWWSKIAIPRWRGLSAHSPAPEMAGADSRSANSIHYTFRKVAALDCYPRLRVLSANFPAPGVVGGNKSSSNTIDSTFQNVEVQNHHPPFACTFHQLPSSWSGGWEQQVI